MKIFWPIFILILLSSLVLSHCKYINTTISFGNFKKESWRFITKFSIFAGQASFTFQMKLSHKVTDPRYFKHNANLHFLAFRDSDWEKLSTAKDCEAKKDLATHKFEIAVPLVGDWTEKLYNQVGGDPEKDNQTRVWFFVLSDCDKELWPYGVTKFSRIHYEFTVLNSDYSQFSAEEVGMITWHLIALLGLSGFFISNVLKLYKFFSTQESLNLPFLITTLAILMEFASVVCELGHLVKYNYDGIGNYWLDLGNQIFAVFAQFLIATVMLFIASGWTVRFEEIKDVDIYMPLTIISGIVHILIVLIGKIDNDDEYKFHDYEDFSGWAIVGIKILIWVFFYGLVYESYQKVKESKEMRVFYLRFGVLGTIYLLSFPLLVLGSSWFVPRFLRHKVVVGGCMQLQAVVSVFLTYLFTAKMSGYNHIVYKRRMLIFSSKID